jgi:hypothetical protein
MAFCASRTEQFMIAPHRVQVASFRAQTCIAPDGIAHMARGVGESIDRCFARPTIRYEYARPGKLVFSIRSWWRGVKLMSFSVDIVGHPRGFTAITTEMLGDPARIVGSQGIWGYKTYKQFAQNLAKALQRFDPLSVAVLLEKSTP